MAEAPNPPWVDGSAERVGRLAEQAVRLTLAASVWLLGVAAQRFRRPR
jgi:hypothetical protein